MKLPSHPFDTYCDVEEKKSNGREREKKYKVFFLFYFFIIDASKEQV
jgi:hypothetical protein